MVGPYEKHITLRYYYKHIVQEQKESQLTIVLRTANFTDQLTVDLYGTTSTAKTQTLCELLAYTVSCCRLLNKSVNI